MTDLTTKTKEDTDRVVCELYDHLLSHPFFNTSIRKVLGLKDSEDVTMNDKYWELYTQLVDETLVALMIMNKSGKKDN